MSNQELKASVNKIISEHIAEYIENNPPPAAIYRHTQPQVSHSNVNHLMFVLVTPLTKSPNSDLSKPGAPSSLKQLFLNEAHTWFYFNTETRKFDFTVDDVRRQIQSVAYGYLQQNWMVYNKIKSWNRSKLSSRGRHWPRAEDSAILSLWFDAIQYKLVVDQTCNAELNVFFAKQFEKLHDREK